MSLQINKCGLLCFIALLFCYYYGNAAITIYDQCWLNLDKNEIFIKLTGCR